MSDLTHFDEQGRARMVDVSDKARTQRKAVARGSVRLNPETYALAVSGKMKKGDVLGVAQVAGIMAAKRTSDLVPMCHPIAITGVTLHFDLDEVRCTIGIEATVTCTGGTGVEMEALTAVSVAALTVYDMCKAAQKDILIEQIQLVHKSGGKSGEYHKEEA